eukprot:TRINITY_DN441_c1_g1_i1.p1 TRINITY_DN441_c1_g1~~TRINITY_DN441_c1_g1_i1.p1  ORF type:complete len:276 (+),score=51.60 TRINITY_DN441_c1_g1_i1:121-828(+)
MVARRAPAAAAVLLAAVLYVRSAAGEEDESGCPTGAQISVFAGAEDGLDASCVGSAALYNFSVGTGSDLSRPARWTAACARWSGGPSAKANSERGSMAVECDKGALQIRWCVGQGIEEGSKPCEFGGSVNYHVSPDNAQALVAGKCVESVGGGAKYTIRFENAWRLRLPLHGSCARHAKELAKVRRLEGDTTATTTALDTSANTAFGKALLIAAISVFVVLVGTVHALHKLRRWE